MIHSNLNVNGRLANMAFGVCAIGDGLIRVLSFGFLHTTFTLDIARNQAKKRFEVLKQQHLQKMKSEGVK